MVRHRQLPRWTAPQTLNLQTLLPPPLQASAEKQKAALDTIASRLESLWGILSQCISRIEDSLGQQTPQQEQAHLLPPEAAQVRRLSPTLRHEPIWVLKV